MARYILFFLTIFMYFFLPNKIIANEFIIDDDLIVINEMDKIFLYDNNQLKIEINNASLLDFNEEYVLYNQDSNLYLYSYKSNQLILVSENCYNALLNDKYVIYESKRDENYMCRDTVGSINKRPCFKLYRYSLEDQESTIINLAGSDNYLGDINDDYLVYTSIHYKDEYCSSLCSYINLYSFSNNSNMQLNKYNDFDLDISGNGLIDNEIVYFESNLDVYECEYVQIFYYDITTKELGMVTLNSGSCFNQNSSIVSVNEGYLLFKSKYHNYTNNLQQLFIYSYADSKYKRLINIDANNYCSIYSKKVICLEGNTILQYYPIDDSPPTFNNTKYEIIRNKKESLLRQLQYDDDLTKKENISINIIDSLNALGEQFIKLELCDNFNNCIKDEVLVNIIEKDIAPPKIYCVDTITIRSNDTLDINKYGYALDNIDGKISLEIVDERSYYKRGQYKLLVRSVDSSNNTSYKEIELIVYENFRLIILYYVAIGICLGWIVIIYIFRFKKRH